MTSPEVIYRVRGEKLAFASKELFEIGALDADPIDMGYVRRLNTVMARRRLDMEKECPGTLLDAISDKGTLKKQAELVVFGQWLITGSPGAKPRPGKKPDLKKMLKCIAAIMAEIAWATSKKNNAIAIAGRKSRKRDVTKHALADQWKKLYNEEIKTSDLDAPLRSIRHLLPDYFQHLKSGAATHAGAQIKTSPELKRALKAITGLLPASKSERPEILTEPDVKHPAALMPFAIDLGYRSDAHMEEYRRLPKSTGLNPRLRYVSTNVTATSPSGKIRADRDGKIILMPDVDIRRDYRVHALIDRIAIIVETRDAITRKGLQAQIKKHTGITLWTHDLREAAKEQAAWGVPLAHLDEWKRRGAPFAIMIQDPTPSLLSAILKAITDGPGIEGPVLLHLIEVSVDFFPKDTSKPDEAVLCRERMVGLLQRHHWTRPGLFVDPDSPKPRDADARQIYDEETEHGEIVRKYRYLFPHEKSSGNKYQVETDENITERAIRDRILTTRPGYDLFLNSTLVKGGKKAPCHVSLQHKIANRRRSDNGTRTMTVLSDPERRARVEITLSGTETLQKRGLNTIDDLGNISFRKLTKDFLTFKLGIIEPWEHLLKDAIAQMRIRGVYGIDLRTRALELERRNAMKHAGAKLPRKTEGEGMALLDWQEMNDGIGKALDELRRRWSGFTVS